MAENWQKVRVTFQDADGNEVSAAMWQHSEDEATVFSPDKAHGPSIWIEWSTDYEQVSVEPIRELPTGVGAVIRVNKPQFSNTRDLYTHVGGGWWTNLEGDDVSANAEENGFDEKGWPWEVLSEGIQIGDVK